MKRLSNLHSLKWTLMRRINNMKKTYEKTPTRERFQRIGELRMKLSLLKNEIAEFYESDSHVPDTFHKRGGK